MIVPKNALTIACPVLSIAAVVLGNPVPVPVAFKDVNVTSELRERDGWDGVKAYPWSTDCGASDGNWEGYTWEGPMEPFVCYRYWDNGQLLDMYSLATSGNWGSKCILAPASVNGYHNADCNDAIPHPLENTCPWGCVGGCWNYLGASFKSMMLICGIQPSGAKE